MDPSASLDALVRAEVARLSGAAAAAPETAAGAPETAADTGTAKPLPVATLVVPAPLPVARVAPPASGVLRVFTDGACHGNGTARAAASFAVVAAAPLLGGLRLSGRVAARAYALDGDSASLAFAAAAGDDGPHVLPSNNRGEYLAGCWALRALLCGGLAAGAAVELVTDSNLFLRTMTEWLPARRAKGTARELKNFDIIVVAEELLRALRASGVQVRFVHVRSHRPEPPPGSREHELWAGNFAADALASAALEPGAPAFRVSGGTPPLLGKLTAGGPGR